MRALLLALVLTAAALSVGCGEQDESTPAACLEGPRPYLAALADAPEGARLPGGTSIGECLAENQAGGELATVGAAMIEAATELNAEARAQPGGEAALQLGYIVGAAQRGADDTAGIHADLLRRLVVAARYAPGDQPLAPSFMRAYRQGFDAGHRSG
jgi:hypothetical protein